MKKIISILVLMTFALAAMSQPMTYESFNRLVVENNACYLAEKYNVDIATAAVKSAKVFNDPELSVAYGDNQDCFLQMGRSVEVEIGVNPDLAGVRRARINVAGDEKSMTEASVTAYLSNLRLEAAEAWADAWRLKESCSVLEDSVHDMMLIANSDSMRLEVGEVGRADALQSRLEAQTLKGELTSLKAEYRNALETLSLFCGGVAVTSLEGDLPDSYAIPAESDLYSEAEANRSDLKAAMMSKSLSESNLKLIRASRAFEMGVSLGYSYNKEVRNEIAPAPKFNGVTVGVSIPLKFSSLNKGEVNAARAELLQSEKYCDAARLQVRSEVSQCYNSLLAAMEVMGQYECAILDDARSVARSRTAGYLKGESGLYELLSAQQTYRDVMQAYINARCECFLCNARLEWSVGAL